MAEEAELKVMLSPEEFSRCLSLLRTHTGTAGDSYVQVNYYFDTPDFALSQAHSMLRVRRKKNTLYLQYKNKRVREGDLFVCDELEALLDEFPNKVNPHAFFPEAPALDCGFLGDLVTHRTDFFFPGAVVSLDENIYFGHTDYELEIEGERDGIETVAAFLNPAGSSQSGNGKFSRFLRCYRAYYAKEKGEL